MAKLALICLALVVLVASTQTEVEGFKLRRFGNGFRKIIKDGIRFLFGRRNNNTPTSRPVRPQINAVQAQQPAADVIQPETLTSAPEISKPSKPSPFKRTLIAIKQETDYGQYLYLRGGGPEGKPIAIKHRIAPEDQDSFYASTSQGDNFLDWGGNEIDQGRYQDRITPQGTPMMWTTNDESYNLNVQQDGAGYYDLNVEAGHYWLVDLDMNCSQTTDGWFEFKGYLTWDGEKPVNSGWESRIPSRQCMTSEGPATFSNADPKTLNHIGRCGAFNLVHFNGNTCMIHSIQDVEQWAKDFHGDEPTVEQ